MYHALRTSVPRATHVQASPSLKGGHSPPDTSSVVSQPRDNMLLAASACGVTVVAGAVDAIDTIIIFHICAQGDIILPEVCLLSR